MGRHRDKPPGEMPLPYVVWLLTEADIGPDQRAALEAGLWSRICAWQAIRQAFNAAAAQARADGFAQGYAEGHAYGKGKVVGVAFLKDAVATWARTLALRFHPDRGGSDQAMAAVNHARELLLQLLALDRS